jgi:NAD(P)-dependent dehydrogenase (short-subunit alcohol dehydrogenase family)
VWLITGCSSGFGRSIAEDLLARGEKVVATARNVEKVSDLAVRGDALLLPLDVVSREQCVDAVTAAEAHYGRIDVLVNNAGVGYFGAIEETSDPAARQVFDINFFGTANAIHAALPDMRRRRSGTIVNLTSIGGISGFAAVGYYCASKFAVEGLSDALRAEVEPLGLHVMTVEPSAFRTAWAASSTETPVSIADYQSTAGEAIRAYHDSVGHQAGDPARAAAAIFDAVTSPAPPRHLLLGNEAVDVAMNKLDALRSDFANWERVARGADFPKGSPTSGSPD